MGTLSCEDLQDLFPGPENFLRRKAVWRACQDVLEVSFSVTHHLLKLASSCFCSFCNYFFVLTPVTKYTYFILRE